MNPSQDSSTNLRSGPRFAHLFPLLLPWTFGLTLLIIFVLGTLTRLLPQIPPYLSPHERDVWLLTLGQRSPYVARLYPIGLLTITHTPTFRGLLLVALVLAWLHVAYALYLGTWPLAKGNVPPLHPIALESEHLWHVREPLEKVRGRVGPRLRGRYRVAEMHISYQEARYFARRGKGGTWGSLLFFLGTIVFLAFTYLGITQGWITRPRVLVPESPWNIEQAHATQLILHHIEREGTTSRAYLLVQTRDEEPRAYTVPLGKSIHVGGIDIRYVSTLIGVGIEATTEVGTPIPLQTPEGSGERRLVLLFPRSGTERIVLLPTLGLHMRVVGYTALPTRGYTHPVFLVQIFDENGNLIYNDFVDKDGQITVRHITFHIRRVDGARFQALHYPGHEGRLGGWALLLVGTLWALLGDPLRRLWVQVFGDERSTVVRAWGDVYNIGWHKPLKGTSVKQWVER